jgi:hypothetical protein
MSSDNLYRARAYCYLTIECGWNPLIGCKALNALGARVLERVVYRSSCV